ncbi:MAG TPA: cytochrome c peroxidase [Chitinophagaceae bacterium]|nr:cytochrome c peroxidase [Chitinophagaceae bacterium]
MRKWGFLFSLFLTIVVASAFNNSASEKINLRKIYSQSPDKWPKPLVSPGVEWSELGVLPESPLEKQKDSLKDIIKLGKSLFFDTRLSGSGKISCASCHDPVLNWTDGKERSIGHEGAVNKRNSPSIQNAWFYNRFFWDGRAKSLQDQAFAPLNSETEMHSEMPDIMRKLRRINGYKELFKNAFGDEEINPDRLTEAIAIFEKTIAGNKSRFDEFLAGNKKALSNSELRGLHLFRTGAGCMNCHHGPLLSDNKFHKTNITVNDNDKGFYNVTHREEDIGKFKTPSLRDVMRTGPWMHNGSINNMMMILATYQKGIPSADSLIQPFGLKGKTDLSDLLAFLNAISASPVEFQKPVLPE